uniref:Uncharacterized protein n=1 Tax=Caenorhabditis tropicalis TaxID=1561998 RepID=A0A1I7TEW3_9PELO
MTFKVNFDSTLLLTSTFKRCRTYQQTMSKYLVAEYDDDFRCQQRVIHMEKSTTDEADEIALESGNAY